MSTPPASSQYPCFPDVYEALDFAALAALVMSDGDRGAAQLALLEAGMAASRAFPPGSPEADALNVILGFLERKAASGATA
jgi:hypothetical protein